MKIGILTGGGDCPALNAVIRAAVKTSIGYGWDVLGIEEGFDGLVQCKSRVLTTASVSGILHLGGTILGTTNAANPFLLPDCRRRWKDLRMRYLGQRCFEFSQTRSRS